MAGALVERFVEALGELEEKGDAGRLVALFSDDCEFGNVVARESFQGAEGARRFWVNYRETFGRVRSTFRNRIMTDNRAPLSGGQEERAEMAARSITKA